MSNAKTSYSFAQLAGTHPHATLEIVVGDIRITLNRYEGESGKGVLIGCGEKYGIHGTKSGNVGSLALVKRTEEQESGNAQ